MPFDRIDSAPEERELVELEATEMLESHGFASPPMVRGSALEALQAAEDGRLDAVATRCIDELIAAMDEHIPEPERDFESPFLMPIENVHTIPGRGTVVTGRGGRGAIRVGDETEILGLTAASSSEPRRVVVTGTQAFHRDVPQASAGMNVGLLLRGVRRDGGVRAAQGRRCRGRHAVRRSRGRSHGRRRRRHVDRFVVGLSHGPGRRGGGGRRARPRPPRGARLFARRGHREKSS